MQVSVRELKGRLSAYLHKASAGSEVVMTSHGKPMARLVAPRGSQKSPVSGEAGAIARLRRQPWIRPGHGKLRVPRATVRLKPGEKSLAEIVHDQRR